MALSSATLYRVPQRATSGDGSIKRLRKLPRKAIGCLCARYASTWVTARNIVEADQQQVELQVISMLSKQSVTPQKKEVPLQVHRQNFYLSSHLCRQHVLCWRPEARRIANLG